MNLYGSWVVTHNFFLKLQRNLQKKESISRIIQRFINSKFIIEMLFLQDNIYIIFMTRDILFLCSNYINQIKLRINMENFKFQTQPSSFKSASFENILKQQKSQFEKSFPNIVSQEIKYDDASRYVGTLVNAKREGYGEYYFSNNDYYKGMWKNDFYEGYGIYRYSSQKKIYYGEFSKGIYHGKGKIVNEGDQSIVYDGQWDTGLKHGTGIYRYSENQYYQGSWAKGMKQGKGTSYKDGQVYIGEWFQNKRNGNGSCKTKQGIIFSGIWKNDVIDRGSIQYPNKNGNDKYQGQILRGMRNGKGVYFYSDGGQFKGQFEQDVKISGTQSKNGAFYTGQFSKNKKEGPGVYNYANGDRYQGNFSQGKRHGKNCVYTWADGSTFNGTFQKDIMWEGLYIDNADKIQRKIVNGQVQ